jgi:hypothetical protein
MSLAGNRPRAFELSKRSFWNVANQYCELNLDRTYAASSSFGTGPSSLEETPVESCGIPHLAKNERDMGHPGICCGAEVRRVYRGRLI